MIHGEEQQKLKYATRVLQPAGSPGPSKTRTTICTTTELTTIFSSVQNHFYLAPNNTTHKS